MAHVFVAVGSNLGERQGYLDQAKVLLGQIPGIKMIDASPVYETHPVGGGPQGKYLNAVWEIETTLPPGVLLQKFLDAEKKLGRERNERNAPRTIDLDILSYDREVIDRPGLTIPHPRLHERLFVLEPLADLDPDWIHPKLKKTVKVLLKEARENHSKS